MAETTLRGGRWCLGHGVEGQAESLRLGHYVPGELVKEAFSTRDGDARASKGFARTTEPRCRICRSIRGHHDHHENALIRSRRFRREHAARWAKAGRCSVETALFEMDIGGVTDEALAALLLSALGESCPGLCAHEVEGHIVFHTIDTVKAMHLDVRDPTAPFSIENIGVLCSSCNQAKGDLPWALFVYMRRAALRVWQLALDNAAYRREYQPPLFD